MLASLCLTLSIVRAECRAASRSSHHEPGGWERWVRVIDRLHALYSMSTYCGQWIHHRNHCREDDVPSLLYAPRCLVILTFYPFLESLSRLLQAFCEDVISQGDLPQRTLEL